MNGGMHSSWFAELVSPCAGSSIFKLLDYGAPAPLLR
jgi:hypothetical protein